MFLDYAEIYVRSGKGGDGAVAFRREKYVPKGGPAGGNGGRGADVIIKAHHNLHTLLDFKYQRKYEAENGKNGGTSLKDGKSGQTLVIKVPIGTVVKDKTNEKIVADLDEDGKEIVIAKGGRGGKGNATFATSTNRAPRKAEKGKPGEEVNLALELKLVADVGLVGFPNAGKSTLISSISKARPKIADYPFTTLEPNLGIVQYKEFKSFVVADIPGIIEGAHQGKGLGHKFLKHIERTKILLILIDSSTEKVEEEYKTILNELKSYSELLASKKKILAFSKSDLIDEKRLEKLKKISIDGSKEEKIVFSSVAHFNLPNLLDKIWETLKD